MSDGLCRLNSALDHLLTLQKGWLDGDGDPVAREAVESARGVLSAYIESDGNAPYPFVYPTPDGGVQAEMDLPDGSYFEVLFTSGRLPEACRGAGSRSRTLFLSGTPAGMAAQLIRFLGKYR